MACGAPSSAARAGSGMWDENGIVVDRRSSAMSANDPTGSSTFATSSGSSRDSTSRAVSNVQPMFASSRSVRSPIAALISRARLTIVVRRPHADFALKCRGIVVLDHARAVGGDLCRRLLAAVAVREVLRERDFGATSRPEQLVQRHARFARRDVPKRQLDSCERIVDEHLAVGAVVGRRSLATAECGEHLGGVAPDERGAEIAPERRRVARRRSFAEPDHAVLGRHPHDGAMDAGDDAGRHLVRRLQGHVDGPCLDLRRSGSSRDHVGSPRSASALTCGHGRAHWGCGCGAVRFEVTAPFESATYCHAPVASDAPGTAASAQGRASRLGACG